MASWSKSLKRGKKCLFLKKDKKRVDFVCTLCIIQLMKQNKHIREQKEAFLKEIKESWPVVTGAITHVRKPCIQKNCRACQEGRKHPAAFYSWSDENQKRKCMYVPIALIPVLTKAIENGRKMERRMREIGVALIHEFREEQKRVKKEIKKNEKN